jgi:hypothetical protein
VRSLGGQRFSLPRLHIYGSIGAACFATERDQCSTCRRAACHSGRCSVAALSGYFVAEEAEMSVAVSQHVEGLGALVLDRACGPPWAD